MTSRFLSSKNMVLFVCSGVGHINRGYETHMIDLFDTLIKEGYSNLYFLTRCFNLLDSTESHSSLLFDISF